MCVSVNGTTLSMNGEGSHKEVHNHYTNGNGRMLWAWASGSTLLVIALLGVIWNGQGRENDQQREDTQELQVAVRNLGERVGALEVQVRILQRMIESQQRE